MHKTAHPNHKKNSSAVNSCQSAVKLDLQNVLNLTLSGHGQDVESKLSITQLNLNLTKIHSNMNQTLDIPHTLNDFLLKNE